MNPTISRLHSNPEEGGFSAQSSSASGQHSQAPNAKSSTQAAAKERRFIPGLTGLRTLTIGWVVLAHLERTNLTLMPGLKPFVELTQRAHLRIDILYLLSGFMLAYVYVKPNERFGFKAYGGFLRHRLVALYPAHLVTLLALIAAAMFSSGFHISVHADKFASYSALPYQFTLTQAWPFLPDNGNTWNYPTWFLSMLWLGYLTTFPFAWLLARTLKGSGYAFLWVFGPLLVWIGISSFSALAELHEFLKAVCELLSGVALCSVFVGQSRFVAVAQKHLDKIVVVYLALFIFAYKDSALACVGLIAGLPFLMAGLTSESSFTSKLMTSRPVMWLAKFSYAIFVSHALAIKFLKVLLPCEHFVNSPLYVRIGVMLAYKVAVICFACAVYAWVEQPCKKLLKTFPGKRRGSFHPARGLDHHARAVEGRLINRREPLAPVGAGRNLDAAYKTLH